MSAHGTIELVWANGRDTFCLAKIGERLALEHKCDAGLGAILQRLENGTWYLRDVRESIRLGLIGGGMKPQEAEKVVERCVDGQVLAPNVLLAFEVLAASVYPPPGEQPGKPEADRAAEEFASTTQPADLSDPPSMPSELDSDGNQERPTSTPSGNSPLPSRGTTEPTAETRP